MGERENFRYEIQYTKAADKFLRLHENVRKQYEASVEELLIGEHPEKVDVKRIKGKHNDYFRIRIGEYRIIYAVISRKIIVINTFLAGMRGDVYKKIGGLK